MVAQATSDSVRQKELSYEGTYDCINNNCVFSFGRYTTLCSLQPSNTVGRLWLRTALMQRLINGTCSLFDLYNLILKLEVVNKHRSPYISGLLFRWVLLAAT